MWASNEGHADIVTMLIQAGANVNYQDRQVMLLCTAFACKKLAPFLQRCWKYTQFSYAVPVRIVNTIQLTVLYFFGMLDRADGQPSCGRPGTVTRP
jgi:ankyrin repeat protein